MKTEIGIGIVGSAICAVMVLAAWRLAGEPFYAACAMFAAALWGALAGCAAWSAIRRGGERDADRDWCSIIWRR